MKTWWLIKNTNNAGYYWGTDYHTDWLSRDEADMFPSLKSAKTKLESLSKKFSNLVIVKLTEEEVS